MSSSQNFSVYKTLPYNVYARADGKWDYLQTEQTFNSSQSINITMQNYDGLSMSSQDPHLSAMPIDFSNTILPWKWDYYDKLETAKYCLMPAGQYYYDVQTLVPAANMVGSLSVQSDNSVTSFSNSDYIVLKDYFPVSYSTWEAGCGFSFSNTANYQTIFCVIQNQLTLTTYQNKLALYVTSSGGSSNDIANRESGTTVLSANTKYWIKIVFDGNSYIIYLSTTGAFAGEETTEISVSSSLKIAGNQEIRLGDTKSTINTWPMTYGTIYMDACYIKIDGTKWWNGIEYSSRSYQGCTYNYTDDGSATTLNAFVVNGDKTMVLTPDNSYTNGYLLGTVNIPAHTAYNYSGTSTLWTQPVLSDNGTIGGDSFACAMSSIYMNSYPAWKAFDGDMVYSANNVAHTGNSMPAWFEFYNPEPIVVTQMTVYNGNVSPVDWQFQCSDDGNLWSVLTSGTNTVLTDGGEWNFSVPNSGAHKYYRFYVTSSSYQNYVSIAEFVITAYTVTATWTAK